jgi:hypothetical protein
MKHCFERCFNMGSFVIIECEEFVNLCLFCLITMHNKKKHSNHHTKFTSLVFVFYLKACLCN